MRLPAGFLCAVLVLFISACATDPVDRQDQTSRSLIELRDQMRETRAQVDRTLVSLASLMTVPPEQLRPAFQQYANNADTIAKQAAAIDKEAREMKRRSNAWLTGWQRNYAEVRNPELRGVSEQRREQVLSRFDNIDRSLASARETFGPFVTNLQDVRKVVGNDLTPRGVALVSTTAVVQNANENGAAAARALDTTIADLEALLEVLTPAPGSAPVTM